MDGEPGGEKTRLRAGQQVAVQLPAGAFLVAPNPEVPVRVIYEDDSIAVLDKPAGLVSEPGIGHKLDTLLNGLIARYGEAQDRIGPEHDYGMVHRLDRDTSGLMVIAKNVEAHERLSGAVPAARGGEAVHARCSWAGFRSSPAKCACRWGGFGAAGAPWASPARASRSGRSRDTASWSASMRATLVEAFPQTGRWRQIRLHFRALGHPVAGDPDEGDAAANAELARAAGLGRMFLHAGALKFRHPATGRPLAFSLALPDELEKVLSRLRRARSLESHERRGL